MRRALTMPLAALVAVTITASLGGCEKKDSAEKGPAEKAGEKADDAVKDANKKANEALDKVGEE